MHMLANISLPGTTILCMPCQWTSPWHFAAVAVHDQIQINVAITVIIYGRTARVDWTAAERHDC